MRYLSRKYKLDYFYLVGFFLVMTYDLNLPEMVCKKCKKTVNALELYKIVMFIVSGEFSDHYYEHVECPDNFTI